MIRSRLFIRITLLVILIEITAFGTLGTFYVTRFSEAAEQRLVKRMEVLGNMLASEDLPISTIGRKRFLDELLGADTLSSMVIGGNGRVIVSSMPWRLGRLAADLPSIDSRWLDHGIPPMQTFWQDETLTSVKAISNPHGGAILYTVIVTVSTAQLEERKQAIVQWGLFASALFILLTSAAIIYIAHRFITRRVDAALTVLDQAASGALDVRIDVTATDEIGKLQGGINTMIAKVGNLLQEHKETAETYRAQKNLLQSIIEHAPIRVFWKDRYSRYLGCNSQFARDAGFARQDDVSGKTDFELSWSGEAEAIRQVDRAVMDSGKPKLDFDESLISLGGRKTWLRTSKVPLRDDDGHVFGILGVYSDISAQKETEADLRLYASVFSHSHEAILISDPENRIIAVNPAFTRLTGYTIDDAFGRNPNLLASGLTSPDTYRDMWAELERNDHWQGELIDRRKDGSVYPKWLSITAIRNPAREVIHYLALFTDITERKDAEKRIHYLAHHDDLTGLINRNSLQDRLGQALVTAQRIQVPMAVMFIDMDRFKNINDTLGHHVGDLLLIEVANRLRHCVRESDIVARLGGDEFIVVLTGMESSHDAMAVSGKVHNVLAQPYTIDGTVLYSTPSIGISLFPADGDSVEALMKNADTAMYHAKSEGRNNIQFFTANMNAAASERMELENELRNALAAGQLELHYQPQIHSGSGKVCGVEALLRWRHPERGLIPPVLFITIAEESGLIEAIGNWVIEEGCRQIATWRKAGYGGMRMAINLSAHQLHAKTLVEEVRAAIARHGVLPGELELEITESVAMEDPEEAIQVLQALRGVGVWLAIDDFGTGYSSLAYLKQLPVHTLKIDRSFVKDIETDADDASICASILALAHSLDLKVVAEGVETVKQRDFLVGHGCDYLQGYFFARPLPEEQCRVRLDSIGIHSEGEGV